MAWIGIHLVTLGNPNCEGGSVVTSLNGFGRNSAENSFLLQSQVPFFAFLCSMHRIPDFEVENTSAAFGLQLRFCETVRRGKNKEKRKRELEREKPFKQINKTHSWKYRAMNIHALVCSDKQTKMAFLCLQTRTLFLLSANSICTIAFSVCEWFVC